MGDAGGQAQPVGAAQTEAGNQTPREELLVRFSAQGERIDERRITGTSAEREAERESAENELQQSQKGGYARLVEP